MLSHFSEEDQLPWLSGQRKGVLSKPAINNAYDVTNRKCCCKSLVEHVSDRCIVVW